MKFNLNTGGIAMKGRGFFVVMAVFLSALLMLPVASQAAMWVGAELGGNLAAATGEIEAGGIDAGRNRFNAAVIGGPIIGYDFVNTGFGGYAWPEWMKYFSVATDITYNRLDFDSGTGPGGFRRWFIQSSSLRGSVVAWTFMLMAHYGFFPDSVIPTGRVNPYIGVGPAIVWSSISSLDTQLGHFSGGTSTNVGLVVEPGIRLMALPNVSIDTSMRYRRVAPTYGSGNNEVKIDPINMFAFLLRVNYHF
jgi:hypothetical protein